MIYPGHSTDNQNGDIFLTEKRVGKTKATYSIVSLIPQSTNLDDVNSKGVYMLDVSSDNTDGSLRHLCRADRSYSVHAKSGARDRVCATQR